MLGYTLINLNGRGREWRMIEDEKKASDQHFRLDERKNLGPTALWYILNFSYLLSICKIIQVGHNIFILATQLSRHNEELQMLLKPENQKDATTHTALLYYKQHTAQIEVYFLLTDRSFSSRCEYLKSVAVCMLSLYEINLYDISH